MNTALIVALLLFLAITVVLWLVTKGPMIEEYGIKMWKQGASRLAYWQGIIYMSFGLTFILLLVLRWGNVLSF